MWALRYTPAVFLLQRYVVRESGGLFLLGLAAFCLLLSIDFLSVLARFLIEHQASPATVGWLLLLKLPWFLHLTMPLALVFAVLLATGRLARDSELKATYAAGIHPRTLLTPLVAFGVIVAFLSLVNNGFIEPLAEEAYERRIEAFIYVRPPNETQTDVAYRVPGEGIYYAARVSAEPGAVGTAGLRGAVVLAEDGTVTSARNGVWTSEGRAWTLESAARLQADGEVEALETATAPFDLTADPQDTLVQGAQLTLTELAERISAVAAIGGSVASLRFDLHRRLADAASAVVFALLAGTLGLQLRGRAAGFGWTIVLLVVFWAVWFLSGNLFERNVLGPVAAAWFTPAAIFVPTALFAAVRMAR